MSDLSIEQAIAEMRDLVRCRCHPAFTERKLHDPDCNCDSAEAVEVLANALPAVQPELHELADDLEALADDLCHLSEAARFNLHTRAAGIRNALVALIDKPAVQPVREEVMPDVEDTQHTRPDAAPASTAYAGGGAWDAMLYGMGVTLGGQHVPIDKVFAVAPPDREEVAEALWRADQYQGQIRSRFADIESYNRNHWLKLADVAIDKIKGEKK